MIKRRGFKVMAGLVTAAVLLVGCSSADSGDVEGDKIVLGADFPVLDQFLQTVADAMQAKADELGVELQITTSDNKTDQQLANVENFISNGVDGIIVLPIEADATGPVTEAAQSAEIPLVYVNRHPAVDVPGVPFVGSDELFAGTVEMEALAELAGNEGNVVILQGPPGHQGATLRTQGCKDVAAAAGMTVTKEQVANWSREEALGVVENWIQAGDPIAAVCANNDEMALGAIQAFKNAGMLDEVVIGGVDATPDALAAMEAGDLEVTVFQDGVGQGAGGVETVLALINGETVEDYVDIPFIPVTPENLADFLG